MNDMLSTRTDEIFRGDVKKLPVEVRKRLVNELYERSRFYGAALLALTLISRWALAPAFALDQRLHLLFYALLSFAVIQLALTLLPVGVRDRLGSHRVKLAVFLVPALAIALLLSAAAIFSCRHLEALRFTIFTFIIAAGVISLAISGHSASRLVFLLYMLPPVITLLVLTIFSPRPYRGTPVMATAIAVFALAAAMISRAQFRILLQNVNLSIKLEKWAVRDGLTNLYNRRFLNDVMARETTALKRAWFDIERGRLLPPDTYFGIFILDLDFFKGINDAFGHALGDDVLVSLSQKLQAEMRPTDLIVRWGGDEFVIILGINGLGDLEIIAERLRRFVANFHFRIPGVQPLAWTGSVGFSVFPFQRLAPFEYSWEKVLALADAALYAAKMEGRNRCVGVLPGPEFVKRPFDFMDVVLKGLNEGERQGWIRITRLVPPPKP